MPEAADNPITRSTALLSLICALMSLSYGCIYIMRFGTMRSIYRSSMWDEVRFCVQERIKGKKTYVIDSGAGRK